MIAAIHHTVIPGDTLYAIAMEAYGNGNDWSVIWDANRALLANPNLIYPGQKIYVPRHAAQASTASYNSPNRESDSDSDNDGYVPRHSSENSSPNVVSNVGVSRGGTLGCSGLESLWIANGGNPASAFIAAEIAMAESGGQQYATGGVGERGYWQISPIHGSLSTYDPNGNARAAIELSGNGTDWSPWTTYTSGAYAGRC